MNVDPTTQAIVNLATQVTVIWLKPTLEKFRNKLATKADLVIDVLTNSFNDYLTRGYEKYSYLPTIAFPNQKKPLKDLYIALTLQNNKDGNVSNILVDSYPEKLLEDEKDILIVDTAGMGKSTITKYLFLKAIEDNKGIPVIIELRKLTKTRAILDVIHEELNGIRDQISKEFLAEVIERGDFIFFFDGYDEIPSEDKSAVTDDLQNFKFKANKNKFIITSRDEPGLASFPEFRKLNIRSLERDESFALIKKYAVETNTAESLIQKIQSGAYPQIGEFLHNPLLVSLLYKSYEYKPTIPLKMSVFYRQVYDSLFENHDFSKGGDYQRKKRSGLDIDQFHSVLRALGYLTYKGGQTELDSDSFLVAIDKAKRFCTGLTFAPSDLKSDLVNQVPLFIREGNHFRWSHKSIQEYFAACFICFDAKAKQPEILNGYYESKGILQHANLLALCLDIDPKSFRRTIVRRFLEDSLSGTDRALQTLSGSISADLISKREALTFSRKFVVINSKRIFEKGYTSADPGLRTLDPLNQAHIDASRLAAPEGAPSATSWTQPSALCVVTPAISSVFYGFIGKPGMDFVSRLPPTPHLFVISVDDKYDFIPLNEDPDNPLNSPDQFEAVTRMIEAQSQFKLDLEKVRETVREIENEIAEEEASDLFAR